MSALVFGVVCACGIERVHVLPPSTLERVQREGLSRESLAKAIDAEIPAMTRLAMERIFRDHHAQGHSCSFTILERELPDVERRA